MPGPWDTVSERKLLLCIIALHAKLEWNVIAQLMGEKFTGEACRYAAATLTLSPPNVHYFYQVPIAFESEKSRFPGVFMSICPVSQLSKASPNPLCHCTCR